MRFYLAIFLFLSFASAQQNASHNVSVRLPVILKLSLDGQLNDSSADVALDINVKDGVYKISPAQTQIKVLSNTQWQLNIEARQGDANAAIHLSYQLNDENAWQPIRNYPQVVRQGEAQNGSEMTLNYGLSNIPPDGRYQAVVSYTLTNP